jgi:hypothetical protein
LLFSAATCCGVGSLDYQRGPGPWIYGALVGAIGLTTAAFLALARSPAAAGLAWIFALAKLGIDTFLASMALGRTPTWEEAVVVSSLVGTCAAVAGAVLVTWPGDREG